MTTHFSLLVQTKLYLTHKARAALRQMAAEDRTSQYALVERLIQRERLRRDSAPSIKHMRKRV